jgi:4'-phosphopantetheinyl transferase
LDELKSHLFKLKALLSAEEIERSLRLKIKEKQEQFVCSRAILRTILGSYLDKNPANLQIQPTPDGKPYLKKSEICFNLSHSGNILLYGFSHKSLIGIDIQQIYPITNIETIIKNYFSETERKYLESQPVDQLMNHFFSIWTAKEAYLKAIGKGFQESPSKISTIPDKSLKIFHLDHPQTQEKSQGWTITSIEVNQNYKAAVAVNGKIGGIKVFPFNSEVYFSD